SAPRRGAARAPRVARAPRGAAARAPSPPSRADPRRELGRAVAPARQIALDEHEQAWHAVGRRRAVGDVLARERVLMHARVHVAGVDGVDAEVGPLDAEDGAELL